MDQFAEGVSSEENTYLVVGSEITSQNFDKKNWKYVKQVWCKWG